MNKSKKKVLIFFKSKNQFCRMQQLNSLRKQKNMNKSLQSYKSIRETYKYY
ncbi:unnamed protein product [Paramecium sonneborni]|uniref:Barwin domain-containing protein n=1 Tax=Paramecium sonneborni TaxID=65129 RepID=A0A8S1KNG0_9CILI|nr:unnamed protein product [Paramecium sonneborni]